MMTKPQLLEFDKDQLVEYVKKNGEKTFSCKTDTYGPIKRS